MRIAVRKTMGFSHLLSFILHKESTHSKQIDQQQFIVTATT
jgi:hypothetical protein